MAREIRDLQEGLHHFMWRRAQQPPHYQWPPTLGQRGWEPWSQWEAAMSAPPSIGFPPPSRSHWSPLEREREREREREEERDLHWSWVAEDDLPRHRARERCPEPSLKGAQRRPLTETGHGRGRAASREEPSVDQGREYMPSREWPLLAWGRQQRSGGGRAPREGEEELGARPHMAEAESSAAVVKQGRPPREGSPCFSAWTQVRRKKREQRREQTSSGQNSEKQPQRIARDGEGRNSERQPREKAQKGHGTKPPATNAQSRPKAHGHSNPCGKRENHAGNRGHLTTDGSLVNASIAEVAPTRDARPLPYPLHGKLAGRMRRSVGQQA
jgi:hypothetical protein